MKLRKLSMFAGRCAVLLAALSVWNGATERAAAQDLRQWRFYADAEVHPQADDSFDAVYVDFTRLFKRDLKQQGALDENSIRVAPLENGKVGAIVPSRFVKDAKFDAARNAIGTVVFQVAGTPEAESRQYRIFFDTLANGPKPAPETAADVPAAANMVWNGGFEILSEDYSGPNRYKNAGTKLPHGWWGNLRNRKIAENPAKEARSGKHAFAFVAPEGENIGISAAPSPPALRVTPGENYTFSFWAKGEGLTPSRTILIASVYWYGKDGNTLPRVRVDGLPTNLAEFPWLKGEVTLPAPADARYGALRISTYSSTGLVTIDDLEARVTVPPLLRNAKLNQ